MKDMRGLSDENTPRPGAPIDVDDDPYLRSQAESDRYHVLYRKARLAGEQFSSQHPKIQTIWIRIDPKSVVESEGARRIVDGTLQNLVASSVLDVWAFFVLMEYESWPDLSVWKQSMLAVARGVCTESDGGGVWVFADSVRDEILRVDHDLGQWWSSMLNLYPELRAIEECQTVDEPD